MGRRLVASVVVALAFVSAACSGSTEGEGDAAPAPSTTTAPTTAPDASLDAAPAAAPPSGARRAAPSRARDGSTSTPHGGAAASGTATTAPAALPSATTTTAALALPPGLPPEKCPEPKTCRRYYIHPVFQNPNAHYPTGADGRVTIEWSLNLAGLDTTTLTVEEAEKALAASFATWERAAPVLRFVYRGRTDRPGTLGDGVNVVDFQGTFNYTSYSDAPPEFDIHFTPTNWTWAPCEQRDGACTPVERRNPFGTGYLHELQDYATHEVGHAIGLGHVSDDKLDRWMTMNPGTNHAGGRFHQTLALGDVLGARALYPCDCPLPPIYDP